MCHAANIIESYKKSEEFGIETTFNLNFSKLMSFKNKTVKRLSKGVESLLRGTMLPYITGLHRLLIKTLLQ